VKGGDASASTSPGASGRVPVLGRCCRSSSWARPSAGSTVAPLVTRMRKHRYISSSRPPAATWRPRSRRPAFRLVAGSSPTRSAKPPQARAGPRARPGTARRAHRGSMRSRSRPPRKAPVRPRSTPGSRRKRPSRRHRARSPRLRSKAIAAPWPDIGESACAASPTRSTRRSYHRGESTLMAGPQWNCRSVPMSFRISGRGSQKSANASCSRGARR
jgi:hypothetical protein